MKEYCHLCGAELVDGVCPNGHAFKKMCLNCKFMALNENGEPICVNDENLKDATQKIYDAITKDNTGYKVDNLTFDLSPLPLKKPALKCGRWAINEEDVLNAVIGYLK